MLKWITIALLLAGNGLFFVNQTQANQVLKNQLTANQEIDSQLQENINVVYLNPGAVDESFWLNVDNVMRASAQAQGINLAIHHANRDRIRMLSQAVEVASQISLPNYLIMVNDKEVAKKVLQIFYRKPVYIVFMINDIEHETRLELLKDPHWQQYLLPAVIEDNYYIGRASAAELTEFFSTQPAHVVAVAGDKVRATSLQRTQAMEGYFNIHLDIVLEQVVYADWQKDKAYEQTQVLLNRFPGVDGIWTGNDEMAVGVVKALKETHRKPGEDVKISTVNPSNLSYELLKKGEVNSVGGGSFLLGGVVPLNITQHQQTGRFDLCLDEHFYRQLNIDSPLFSMIVEGQWHQIYQQEIAAICQVNE
ncbi:ABC transporter substrate-binding protein [Shewanella sp. TC10]|uniref:ABC transporter substrate-binding protein n=1 Tax=Shewanella sp. TC10 TaxID=1419739 RepID=UPI00129DEFA9|nr:ABC transporter substrate-binding protein [Shewanella sp. TC10]